MAKDPTRMLLQMLKEKEPLTTSEFRELVIRHLLADPMNRSNSPITASFFDAYINLHIKEEGDRPEVTEGPIEANHIMKEQWWEAGADPDMWAWPSSIPQDCRFYPKDILIQVALGLAHEQLGDLADDSGNDLN